MARQGKTGSCGQDNQKSNPWFGELHIRGDAFTQSQPRDLEFGDTNRIQFNSKLFHAKHVAGPTPPITSTFDEKSRAELYCEALDRWQLERRRTRTLDPEGPER